MRALFLRVDLVGATFSNSDLKGALFIGADISGVDFRGARNLSLPSLLSAIWDPENPPTMDARFNHARNLFENRRVEASLAGASLQLGDPKAAVGPPRRADRFARFQLGSPPHMGMSRLVALLIARDCEQLMYYR